MTRISEKRLEIYGLFDENVNFGETEKRLEMYGLFGTDSLPPP